MCQNQLFGGDVANFVYQQRYTDISDPDVDEVMRDLVTRNPNSGLAILRGHLRRLGTHVPRERARLSMIRVDPINVCMRRMRSKRPFVISMVTIA